MNHVRAAIDPSSELAEHRRLMRLYFTGEWKKKRDEEIKEEEAYGRRRNRAKWLNATFATIFVALGLTPFAVIAHGVWTAAEIHEGVPFTFSVILRWPPGAWLIVAALLLMVTCSPEIPPRDS